MDLDDIEKREKEAKDARTETTFSTTDLLNILKVGMKVKVSLPGILPPWFVVFDSWRETIERKNNQVVTIRGVPCKSTWIGVPKTLYFVSVEETNYSFCIDWLIPQIEDKTSFTPTLETKPQVSKNLTSIKKKVKLSQLSTAQQIFRGLKILLKNDPELEIGILHETLTLESEKCRPKLLNPQDKKRLKQMGFDWESETHSWIFYI